MPLHIRAARPADLPQIYAVLDAAFDAPLELFAAQTEHDSTFRWRHARVAELSGNIVAHVRIFDRIMLLRGVPVRAGGIGSVATLPQYEGSGYASALLHDAMHEMHRLGMAIGFLYTGIPEFYERLGWRVVLQPAFRASVREAAATQHEALHRVRPAVDADVPALVRLHRAAIAGATGAVVRSARTWRDQETWLGLDAAGTLVAGHAGRIVAYVRSARRGYFYTLLEAEHARGHETAVASLLVAAATAAAGASDELNALVPDDHALATALRSLPSTTWSTGRTHVPHPMMMRIISLDRLLGALLPQLRDRARTHRGDPLTLTLHAPDGEHATLAVSGASATLRRRPGDYTLDEQATLAAILGQQRASKLVRPRPPRNIARRIDALFPETPLHFWNSDRI
jgi:predicted N-acetyltransferase YhbS